MISVIFMAIVIAGHCLTKFAVPEQIYTKGGTRLTLYNISIDVFALLTK